MDAFFVCADALDMLLQACIAEVEANVPDTVVCQRILSNAKRHYTITQDVETSWYQERRVGKVLKTHKHVMASLATSRRTSSTRSGSRTRPSPLPSSSRMDGSETGTHGGASRPKQLRKTLRTAKQQGGNNG